MTMRNIMIGSGCCVVLMLALTAAGSAPTGALPPSQSDQQKREVYARMVGERKELVDRLAALPAKLAAVEQSLKAPTSASWMDEGNQPPDPNGILTDALKLRIELEGMRARQVTLERTVEELNAAAQKAAAGDEVAQQLQDLVKIKEANYTDLKKLLDDKGSKEHSVVEAGVSTVRDAEVALLEARVRLADRREAVAARTMTPGAARLRDQLIEIAVSVNETQAKLDAIEKILSRMALLHEAHTLRATIETLPNRIAEKDEVIARFVKENPAATQPAQ